MFRLMNICLICMTMSGWLYAEPVSSPLSPLSKASAVNPLKQKFLLQNASLIKPPLLAQNFLIVLDPGHGGHDAGTQSISKPRYQEKSLNLVTAQFVKGFLQQLGYQVFMTREDDTYIALDKRAQLANEKVPTLFVSIHYNAAPIADANGVEVFFYQTKEKNARTLKSKRLAQAILKHVLDHTKAKSRGVKHANYAVIRETNMPAVLVEGGFLTNEAELQNLKDPVYLKKLAWGIVSGIEEYISKLHQPSLKKK